MPGCFDIFIVPALRNIAAYVFIVDSRSQQQRKNIIYGKLDYIFGKTNTMYIF